MSSWHGELQLAVHPVRDGGCLGPMHHDIFLSGAVLHRAGWEAEAGTELLCRLADGAQAKG